MTFGLNFGELIAQRYRITQPTPLGQGGMGAIYEAEDQHTGNRVAIKVMHDHLANHPQFRERFIQEAQSVADLHHPNIVRVLEHSPATGRLYIVMELISGGSLRDYVNRLRHPMSPDEAIPIVQQIAEALHYAHDHHVIHRDVKPENILLKPGTGHNPRAYTAMLTDFGLAKIADSVAETMTGRPFGTFAYMSPEQCKGEKVDRRSDIYSLGIVFYELIAGYLPFEPKTIFEAYTMHVQKAVPSLRLIVPDISPTLERTIQISLAKDRESRFRSAQEFSQALQAFVVDLDGGYKTEPPIATPINQIAPPIKNVVPVDRTAQQSRHVIPAPHEYGVTNIELSALPSLAMSAAPARQEDRVHILDSTGQIFQYVIDKERFRIGRSSQVDIRLSGRYVSREHAIVERRSDGTYWVKDTGSMNPAFIGDYQTSPDRAIEWQYDQEMRLGQAVLTLEAGRIKQIAEPEEVIKDDNHLFEPTSMVEVSMKPRNQKVIPGQQVTFSVQVKNGSNEVDHIRLDLRGIPAQWGKIEHERLQIPANGELETTVTFSPPRDASSRASRHAFTLRAHSANTRLELCKIRGFLHMETFQDFTAIMHPQRLQHSGIVTVQVKNQGNTRTEYRLSGRDNENALSFFATPPRFSLEPGQSLQIPIEIKPRMENLVHGAKPFLFTITVHTAEGTVQPLRGELIAIANLLHQQQRAFPPSPQMVQAPQIAEPVDYNFAPQNNGWDASHAPQYDMEPANSPTSGFDDGGGLIQLKGVWQLLSTLWGVYIIMTVIVQLITSINGASNGIQIALFVFSVLFTIAYSVALTQSWRRHYWADVALIFLASVSGIIIAQAFSGGGTGAIIGGVLSSLLGISLAIMGFVAVRSEDRIAPDPFAEPQPQPTSNNNGSGFNAPNVQAPDLQQGKQAYQQAKNAGRGVQAVGREIRNWRNFKV